MYVMEALRQADRLYPNEFTIEEKLGWIDELNAKLSQEYNKKYGMIHLHTDSRGEALLPEDIDYERIHSIRICDREIKKENFTTYGVRFLYGHTNILAVPRDFHCQDDIVTVIYLKPPEHIRIVRIDDDDRSIISADAERTDGFYINRMILYEGDRLNVKFYRDSEKSETVLDTDINVIGSEIDDGCVSEEFADECAARFYVTCSADNGGDISDVCAKLREKSPVSVMRLITDKTECDMPYDEMFVQWVCARICQWQKEFEGYNQHMTMFNQLLSDYWHHITERKEPCDNTQWKGWI